MQSWELRIDCAGVRAHQLWEVSLDGPHGGPQRGRVLPARGQQRLDRGRAFRGDGEAPMFGDHCEDDLGSVHPRPGELARVDLPENHAEAVPRDKDFIDPVELKFAREYWVLLPPRTRHHATSFWAK